MNEVVQFQSSDIQTMVLFTLFFILVFGYLIEFGFGLGIGMGHNNYTSMSARTFGSQQAATFYQPQAQASHGWGWGGGHGSSGAGGGSGSGFNSFFDVALTGLAFLSFGTFLLNLLLNALLGYGWITGTVYPTYTQTGTGIITQTGTSTSTSTGTAVGRRKREADSATFELDRVSSAEVMASVILQSIDAMVEEHECVKKVFCDGSKDANSIGRGFQYLFPAYSIGASYIGQKYGFHNNLSDHVDAVFHGLENSNCQEHFPQC